MKKHICFFISVLTPVFVGVRAEILNLNEPFLKVEKLDTSTYSKEDLKQAYQSFNDELYDPMRKLYFRDSKKGTEVAAIWTQAIYWDMAMNAYKAEPSKQNKQRIEDIYQGCYEYYAGYDWYSHPDVWFIYDDIMWWVISMARAYELTGEEKYLAHAVSGFNRVWYGVPELDIGSFDREKGGMFWDWTMGRAGKMSCINYPTVVASALLYKITQNESYLEKAKDVYSWSRKNLFNTATGEVADSKHGDGEPHWKPHGYNQGTCVGAAVDLYKITGEMHYLNDAVLAADFTKNTMSISGILPFDTGEEQGIYHAILGQYIVQLAKEVNQPEYLNWMKKNITVGWNNRNERNLTTRNISEKTSDHKIISAYDASGVVGLMLAVSSEN
ncbi:hypothetical protein ORI89_10650 [Sphingobacterium sp. UT-1RO-CII-1]|uniref:glycoside hydrolase family 76 protein n=1 Tax=Sphingobacterium sp. UT-1RO-CII-1 TaxID=2995225 RepID=UPI00227D6E1C|nr:glycoside hydrolase family 76 protein [Sphingobacterium sp. UT-1RO-CII-1]MCY4780112.1 hypothetical protein [Sphingobacterium sp. UT-1RO-CII-1]